MVCHALGLDTSRFSFAYVATWAGSVGDDPLKRIAGSGQRITTAANLVLEALLPPLADDTDESEDREEARAPKPADAA